MSFLRTCRLIPSSSSSISPVFTLLLPRPNLPRSHLPALHRQIRDMSASSTPAKAHPLEFLIGIWSGKGKGFYPTIPSFEFFEEVTFIKDPAGRPIVQYSQKTRRAVPGSAGQDPAPGPPMHAESGFIRLPGWSNEKCELILSQPTGVASVELGVIEGSAIRWKLHSVTRSPSAKAPHVTDFTRIWTINTANKTFDYVFAMATDNTPLQDHLEVFMRKVEA